MPIEFALFGAMLIGIALLHHRALFIATAGAAAIALYRILFAPFAGGPGLTGFLTHLQHEWVILVNLLLLLLGFALLARHFEDSGIPGVLPRWLPDNWLGGFALLALVFFLSGFLDNIAAAMIGGAIAHTVYRGRVHIAYVVGVVAAANAGGSGSVVGDTTTTMLWIAGVSPTEIVEAYLPALVALVLFGLPAAILQQRYSPIQKEASRGGRIDWARAGIVAAILAAAIVANVVVNARFHQTAGAFPFLGVTVASTLLVTARIRRPEWSLLGPALSGALFLLALVLSASMMPVERLPPATWRTTLGLGFLSAGFDNIPLTALAIEQGGYDWGFLAYAVGFGGSMLWFGSSAGVALTTMYPEGRSIRLWLRHGWYVAAAYVVGFAVLLGLRGFHPGE